MRDRVTDQKLEDWILILKRMSTGRQDGDACRLRGDEIRLMIQVCQDLRDSRALLAKTSWLRKLEKKK